MTATNSSHIAEHISWMLPGLPIITIYNSNGRGPCTKKEKFRQLGLAQALELCGIEFDGTQHRALDDAINTVKVFVHQFDKFKLEHNCAADDEGIASKVVYSSAVDDEEKESPFGNLANLFKSKSNTTSGCQTCGSEFILSCTLAASVPNVLAS